MRTPLPRIDPRLLELSDRELMDAVHGEAICRSCKPDVLADLAHRERRNIRARLAIQSVGVRRHPFLQLWPVRGDLDADTRCILDMIRSTLNERGAHSSSHPSWTVKPSPPERMSAAVARRQDEVLARRIVDDLIAGAGRRPATRAPWRRRVDRFNRKRPVEIRGAQGARPNSTP